MMGIGNMNDGRLMAHENNCNLFCVHAGRQSLLMTFALVQCS